MPGSFLDTTVVISIAEDIEPSKTNCNNFISSNQPSEIPYYAIQELLAGRIRVYCETHNVVLASTNAGEALSALTARNPIEGRKRVARLQILAEMMEKIFRTNPAGSRDSMKRELLQEIALKAANVWRKAKLIRSSTFVQPLGCLNEGKLTRGAANELRGPKDSFNCLKNERCAAAAYIYDDKIALDKLIDALHPDNLPPELATKTETQSRKKALKMLARDGANKFNKNYCRALGDAYFAALCPAGRDVVTTNVVDFEPLCRALGKKVSTP